MRCFFFVTILFAFCGPLTCQNEIPGWFSDAKGFCSELAKRTNGRGVPVPIGKPTSIRFADYPSRPVAPQRSEEAVIGKEAADDEKTFPQAIKLAASTGPDFAGRYAIVEWSCGSWCTNSVIADVLNGKMYDTPFAGVVGCRAVTGDLPTIQRRANSALLIVRGSLEMSFDHSLSEGPCGTFYFRWQSSRLRLIGCDIK